MKKISLTLVSVIFSILIFAQSPQGFKYQAVYRDNTGNIIANQNIAVQINLLQGSATGTEVFSETHNTSTNEFGLFNIEIGSENPTDFATIDWANGPYFVNTIINGTDFGTSQLLSVPYALYAKNTDSWSVNADSIYTFKKVGIGTSNITTDNNPDLYIKDIQNSARIKLEGETDVHGSNGVIAFYGINEAAYATIAGIRTSNGAGDIVFKTDNGINHSERLRITGNGNIGIGTSTPNTLLNVYGSTNTSLFSITTPSSTQPFMTFTSRTISFNDTTNNANIRFSYEPTSSSLSINGEPTLLIMTDGSQGTAEHFNIRFNSHNRFTVSGNGIITINNVMKLTPRSSAPSNPEEGQMYMNSSTHKLMVYDGTQWRACW